MTEVEFHLKAIADHERGVKGYLEDLEYEILEAAFNKSNTLYESSKVLKIKRSTLSMKILSFMKKGYSFQKAFTQRRYRQFSKM